VSDPSKTVDDEVLRLRSQGQSYARISRDLGLERAAVAQQAFRRALGRLPEADAKRVRQEELSRLDRLAAQVRADTTRDELDRARQLKTIERMRGQIDQDSLA
jgi:AraC-like DNA-binding protein